MDMPYSHGKHPLRLDILLQQRLCNLNCHTVITQRHAMAVYDKLCLDTVTNSARNIHPGLIRQCHGLGNPTCPTETFTFSNSIRKYRMGNSEVALRTEIHLQYQSLPTKLILAENIAHNCILDLRILDDQVRSNSFAEETTINYWIPVMNVLKNADLLMAFKSVEH
jgi:hypothetical protein